MPISYTVGAFPPSGLDWERLLPLIGPANAALARYDGLLNAIPNASVLLSPLTTHEAVLSSRIEGTQATFGEVLEFEAIGEPGREDDEKGNDIQEVLNYRRALNTATARLSKLPLSQRLLKETHAILMEGVRGRNKAPGQYRRVPNWIGPPGCTLETCRYVPASAEQVSDAMSRWETYLHSAAPDKLVQLAILHAEFEAIHPFLDGNGRLGRLLVPLFLVEKGLLSTPSFYISAYLEAHREEYYSRLLAVSETGDWLGWCQFFLTALTEQAKANRAKVDAILALYASRKTWIVELTHSQYAISALDWLFDRPVFRATDFSSRSGIPKPTAIRILKLVRDAGLLKEIRAASGRRAALYAFTDLLNTAEGRPVF